MADRTRPTTRVAGVDLPLTLLRTRPGERTISYVRTRDYQHAAYGGWDGSWTALDFAHETVTANRMGVDLVLPADSLDPDTLIAAVGTLTRGLAGVLETADAVLNERPALAVRPTAGQFRPDYFTLRLQATAWPAVPGVTVPDPLDHPDQTRW
jgi:hypothetical protein